MTPCVRDGGGACAQMNEFGAGFAGILSRKGRENPTFNDWNAVLVVYCDGGLYAGSRGAYTANLTRPFFIEGHASLASVIHDLRLRGLGSARNVLFSGCSAGAQAVAMTCDAMARARCRPPPSSASWTRDSSSCLMDAGFFLDTPDIQGRLTWRQSVERLFKFHRMGLGIPPACRQVFVVGQCACGRQSVERLFTFHRMGLGTPPACRQGACARGSLRVVAPVPSSPHRLFKFHHMGRAYRPPAGKVSVRVGGNPLTSESTQKSPRPPARKRTTRAAAMEVRATTVQPAIPAHATPGGQQPIRRESPLRALALPPTPGFPHLSPSLTPLSSSLISPIFPSPHTAHAKEPWKCLLPQYNLPFLRTPLMVVNSLQDEIAVKMTFAPPLINGSVRIQKCMDNSPLCPAPYRTALHLYQSRLARTVLGIQRVKRQQGVWFESFLMNSTSHCSAVYGEWVGKVDVLGRQLPKVVEQWFFHGRSGKAGGAGGLVGSGGVKRGGNGTGAGGAGAGAGGVGKGGAGAGQRGNKGGWAGGRPIPRPPKVPGVQAGSAGAGKLPPKRGADKMGAGGRQGGEKGAGGAAGKGQQQGAGKSVAKRPGTAIGRGPGVGAGAGKAPGGQRGPLWPGVRGVRAQKQLSGRAGVRRPLRNEREEEQARCAAVDLGIVTKE
ncbi:unnamed protein product [Closterium sp. NIES-64]|nr:unnamed protein product [Closterium sp. NIES-64]